MFLFVLTLSEYYYKPAGVFSPKLSRIIPQKDSFSPSPAWLKEFEPTVIQNPMTIRRFSITVIEKYLGKESNSKRCVPIKTHLSHSARFHSCRLKNELMEFAPFAFTEDCFQYACAWR
ncbi:hypothetical protein AVEN_118176-1 [Araneus ventricosus]|uniref:Uncharacterized protein n=1 Tax=Araneus ventricosus TaxID=182803 RepID=A0A4Y2TQC9_ARAVE|nr:hypothetical protein AVEN_74286-1 [Araneus ventricosus]GBO02700.1 hypothetical protein AVEN_161677-1 [Araneus ventricosus]GBO02737.1 hypothetical protein AVEN_231724-1 [Araneus ventricosus]GBO02738.1 hypothetical protein AVEN_118176-1 [Araneus ventricosus]